jgi:hypothetical protein
VRLNQISNHLVPSVAVNRKQMRPPLRKI